MGYSAYEALNTLVLYQGILLARHVCSYGKKKKPKKTPAAIKKETQTFLFITRLAVFFYIYIEPKFIPCGAQLKPIRADLAHVYMRKVVTIKIYCLIMRAMVVKCLCVYEIIHHDTQPVWSWD